MKKGINQWAFPEDLAGQDCLRLASDAGFEGVELNVTEEGPLSIDTPEARLDELRDFASELGLALPSVCVEIPCRLTADEQEDREYAHEVIANCLRLAKQLGAGTVLVVSGGVDFSIWTGQQQVIRYDLAYDRLRAGLKRLCPIAEDLGVCIGIENVWDKFLLSPLEFRDLIDDVDCNYVHCYFDVANVLITGYPEQWIAILGKRIKKVHVKDFKVDVGTINGFCNLLEGDVNWPAVMRALREMDYDDYLTAEVMPPYQFHPERLIYETSDSMDAIMETGD